MGMRLVNAYHLVSGRERHRGQCLLQPLSDWCYPCTPGPDCGQHVATHTAPAGRTSWTWLVGSPFFFLITHESRGGLWDMLTCHFWNVWVFHFPRSDVVDNRCPVGRTSSEAMLQWPFACDIAPARWIRARPNPADMWSVVEVTVVPCDAWCSCN